MPPFLRKPTMTLTYADVQEMTKPSPMYVRFYRKPKPDFKATKEKGYPVLKDVIYCSRLMEGDGLDYNQPAVLSFELPEEKQNELFFSRCDDLLYPKQWALFKSGDSEQIVGFRLDAFFVNSPSKAEFYKHFGVHTVEQLSVLPESTLQVIGIEARQDQRLAQGYLKQMEEQAGPRLAKQEVEALQKKLDAAADREEMLLERLAKLEELVQGNPEVMIGSGAKMETVKRRGRPRKDETENRAEI